MQHSPSPSKKRGKKIFLGIIIFFLLLAIAFQVFIDRYLEPIIHERLEKLIVAGSDSLYNFQVEKISVSFWRSAVDVKNLVIQVDSAHYAQREKRSDLPALTFEINLKNGSIGGIGLLPILFDKKINIESIISKNADITFSRHFRKSDKKDKEVNDPLWKLIRPDIKSISISKIILDDININYTNADSAKAFKWKFEHCSTIIDNTKVDSASSADKSRILFSKNVSIQFNDIKLNTVDGLYAVEAKKLWYSSAAKNVEVDSFKFHPILGQQAFYKKVGIDKDRFNLDFPGIRLVNFQLPQWINSDILEVDTIDLEKPQINVYKDRTATPDQRGKLGKYPHQLLQKLPFVLNIKQLHLSDAEVTYTEKSSKSAMEGKLIFQKLHGTVKNVTNDLDEIKKNRDCVADITGLFMQRSQLHAVFKFHLDEAATGGFEVSADIAKLDAAQLNPITVPLAQASIKSLEISELHYYIKGNEKSGNGYLSMLYKNLAIDLTKKDDDDGKVKKRKLLSFLVNNLVVYQDNPMNGKERKAVNIQTIRDPQKSFFNLIWKTMFNSFKEITIRIDKLKDDKSLKKDH
ncbi:MAG: hypothetical protein ABUT20_12875 [Bacteroidota bacterium]